MVESTPTRERLAALEDAIARAQDAFVPPDLAGPEPEVDPQGEADWLYSSDRDYLTQNLYYQARKTGRTVAELHVEAEAVRRTQAEEWAMMQAAFPAGCPPYNTTRHKLGSLCKRGHEWGTTGQSLRSNRKIPTCLYCHAEDNAARRRTPDPGGASPQWVYDPTRSYLKPAQPGWGELDDASDDAAEGEA